MALTRGDARQDASLDQTRGSSGAPGKLVSPAVQSGEPQTASSMLPTMPGQMIAIVRATNRLSFMPTFAIIVQTLRTDMA